MSKVWQRFIKIFDDPEAACIAFLVAIGGASISGALLFYWLAVGRYSAAICFTLMLGVVVGVCIRDYQRGRWSALSYTLVAAWVLVTAMILIFGAVVVHE